MSTKWVRTATGWTDTGQHGFARTATGWAEFGAGEEPPTDQTIFGTETPTNVAEDGVALTQGTKFQSSHAGVVVAGKWWAGASPPTSTKFALYRVSDFAQLGVKVASALAPLAWTTVAYDAPIPILANTDYMAVWWTQNRYPYTASYPYPKVSGDLTASGTFFDVSADISFPDTSTSLSFFCDLVFNRT